LLTIHSALSGKTIAELETQFAGKGYGDFKTEVADVVVQVLTPLRKRTDELMNDQVELLRILKSGAEKANQVASKTLSDVYAALGLIKNG
jgi:tryptophanyl-tRNA synthetase